MPPATSTVRVLMLMLLLFVPPLVDDGPRAEQRVLVFAAASLKNVLDAAALQWSQRGLPPVAIAYAGTSRLARQIMQGAPAQVFVSADSEWMQVLAERGLLQRAPRILAGNRLVLIGPVGKDPGPEPLTASSLRAVLGESERLVLADVRAVPAGRYAKAALEQLELWPVVSHRLAMTDNVRMALALVARGEAPLGIVYATDAGVEPRVQVLARFPAQSHPAIRYPVALLKGASARAAEFVDFLLSAETATILAQAGFEPAVGRRVEH